MDEYELAKEVEDDEDENDEDDEEEPAKNELDVWHDLWWGKE